MTMNDSVASLLPESFFTAIEAELRQREDGISEYDLLKHLQRLGFFEFARASAMSPCEIFRAHFLLYHALYRLRDRLLGEQQAWLEIDVLKIRLLPYRQGADALVSADRLREYYLDLDNMRDTTEQEVYELLASFWNRLGKNEKRQDALAVLGLQDPVDEQTIKQAYRRLVMQHHPDRGGDKVRLQAINAALDLLLG